MNDQECIEKLERISDYCCAQKDKDALDYAINCIKTSVSRAQINVMLGEIEKSLSNVQNTLSVISEDDSFYPKIKGAEDALIDVLHTIHYYTDKEAADVISQSKE